jgi:hypothetical protein
MPVVPLQGNGGDARDSDNSSPPPRKTRQQQQQRKNISFSRIDLLVIEDLPSLRIGILGA